MLRCVLCAGALKRRIAALFAGYATVRFSVYYTRVKEGTLAENLKASRMISAHVDSAMLSTPWRVMLASNLLL